MKIAFIIDFCPHYRYKLYFMLAKKYGFHFYFFRKDQKEKVKRVKVHREGPGFRYYPLLRVFGCLVENRYDIIIKCINNKISLLLSLLIAKCIKAKFIVWHSVWYYSPAFKYRILLRFLLKVLRDYTDAILVEGEHGKDFLVKEGINKEKIFIAWQTADNELYGREVPNEEIENIKINTGIRASKVILYVGRFERYKGIKYFLQALGMIRSKDNLTVFFVGDGPLKSRIEQSCRNFGLQVVFTGLLRCSSLPPYYKLATVTVLPSVTTPNYEVWGFKEPWGLVANEAFNQGCPVVVTDTVGAAAGGLVKDNVNGLIVPERDSEALAEAISSIINNHKLRDELSRNAREEIKSWTYERQAKGVLDAVRYVCN